MSLLSQLRPAPSEKTERRWSKRKYRPSYNLCRHLNPQCAVKGRDPKEPPFRMIEEQRGAYVTPYGVLRHPDVKDQFALHWQWKTASQMNYVYHNPPIMPPGPRTKECYQIRPDMTRSVWPGRNEADGPFEYQQVAVKKGLLPEDKVWPHVAPQYIPFQHNVGTRQDLFREVKHNVGGRTTEDTEKVKDYIRDLVKGQALNTQYVKPMYPYDGLQDEVRVYEGLKRPPGRDPVCWTSEHKAQFGRHIPSKEYCHPRYCAQKPLSKTVVLQWPYNNFNHKVHPHSLDYLPMPHTLTKSPTDLRLISGYNL